MSKYQDFLIFWLWVHGIFFLVLLSLSIFDKIFAKKNLTNDRDNQPSEPTC